MLLYRNCRIRARSDRARLKRKHERVETAIVPHAVLAAYHAVMGVNPTLLSYQNRLVELHATASQVRLGQVVAFGVMALAIVAIIVLAFFSLVQQRVRFAWTFAPVPVAIYSGMIGKRRNSSLLTALRITSYYERGVGRLSGQWVGFGIDGAEFQPVDHSYAKDLHLFGKGSLFELLCTCRTEVGRRRLADYLLEPSTLCEAKRRQQAVQELRDNLPLREEIESLGAYSFQQSTWQTITDWLAAPNQSVPRSLRIFALLASISLGLLVLLGWDQVVGWGAVTPCICVLLLSNAIIGLVYRQRLLAASGAIRSLGTELGLIRQGLELMHKQAFESPLLAHLITASQSSSSIWHLRRLERLLNAFIQRDREWFYLGSRALLVGTQVYFAIEKWRMVHGQSLRRWLSLWGEFEALSCLANYAHEHPQNALPSFSESEVVLAAVGLKHPLLSECIPNDFAVDRKTRFYVLSGSNMSGKSTFLRTIGLNAVLAYAGAPVSADAMHLSRFEICASLAVQDSLLDGTSKFFAEVNRLKWALSVPIERGPVLFLVDEILSGTNSSDRRIAAEAIVKELIARGAVGVLSTHDLALTQLPALEGLPGGNIHLGSRDDSDPLSFDYILKPGITRESNALAIARLAGVRV